MLWRNSSAGGEVPLSMQTMKLSVCWMLIILAGCRLSRATPSHNNLTTVCVPAGDSVSVPCPDLFGNKVKYHLLLGPKNIYNLTCIRDNNGTKCEPPHNRMGIEMHASAQNESAHFILTGVNAISHGIYRCEGEVEFPPPYKTVPSAVRTLVLIGGYQCNINCTPSQPVGDPNCGYNWIYISTSCISIFYGIVMTIITCIACAKAQRIESQSDYMNTKPKPCRDRRKKKGVQIPIPRHF